MTLWPLGFLGSSKVVDFFIFWSLETPLKETWSLKVVELVPKNPSPLYDICVPVVFLVKALIMFISRKIAIWAYLNHTCPEMLTKYSFVLLRWNHKCGLWKFTNVIFNNNWEALILNRHLRLHSQVLGRKGVKCGSVTSCRGTAGPGIENYTQANKFYWTCLEEGSVRRSCTDRKNRG